MLEPPTHDRNANVPPTPSNGPLTTITTTTEQHDASDQTPPRPCKRHCPYPYISPPLAHPATEVHLLAEAETEPETKAEAGVEGEAEAEAEAKVEARPEAIPEAKAKEESTPEAGAKTEAEATAEAGTAQVPCPLTADNLATLPDHSVKYLLAPESIPTSTASSSDSPQRDTFEGMTVSEARTLLKRNRLYMFDSDAEKRAEEIIGAGKKILEQRRDSTMPVPIAENLVQTIKKYGNKGEATFVFHFWKALINDTRQVPELMGDREFTLEDAPALSEWIAKAWDKDYIWGKWNADFATNSLPRFEKTGNPVYDLVFSLIPRITSPRPDIAYGFDDDAFEEDHQQVLHQIAGGKLTNQQFCTFFAVEVKCGERSIEEAENQCCRSGATMAKSRRDIRQALIDKRILLQNLRASIATPSQSTEADLAAPASGPMISAQTPTSNSVEQPATTSNGPIQHKDTISFTLALCPQFAKICIHFAETWNERTEWQMHDLKSYLLQDRDHLQALRHDIDNILDWGCTTRKKQITAQVAEYLQLSIDIMKVREAMSATESAQAKASTPGSKRKRNEV